LTFHEKFPAKLNKNENENYTHYLHCFKHKHAGFLKAKEKAPERGLEVIQAISPDMQAPPGNVHQN